MKKYTYPQIAKLTGKKIPNIRSLAHKLSIERVLIKGTTHIFQDGVDTIQAHFQPKTPRTQNARVKIRVMERYFETFSCRSVAKTCSISKATVGKIVKEWEDTGCITVESSINVLERVQNKGVFKKGSKWGYCIVIRGVKHYKSGFLNESEAIEKLTKLKIRLKQ